MSGEAEVDDPIDSDVDLRVPAQRLELVRDHGPVLGVIALGGGLGALARLGLAHLWPTPPGHFPWATFITNVLGCLLIGVLMVVVTEERPHEIRGLLAPGTVGVAFVYLAGTLMAAMLAVFVGVWATRALTKRGGA